jgi:outer membrane lipoprotein-sorting protein
MRYSEHVLRALPCLLALLLTTPAAGGTAGGLEEVLAESAARYNEISGFSGSFRQLVEIPLLGKEKEFGGRIRYRSPNMLRLDYDVPEGGYILCDGRSFFVYLPDVDSTRVMKTVIDKDPRSFLTEFFLEEAREDYTAHLDSTGREYADLTFTPRNGTAQLARVEVRVDTTTDLVRRISYIDRSGSVTTYSIDDVEIGPQPPELFRFELPAGLRLLDLSAQPD